LRIRWVVLSLLSVTKKSPKCNFSSQKETIFIKTMYVSTHTIKAITRRGFLRYLTYLLKQANIAATQSILDFTAITYTQTNTHTHTRRHIHMKNLL